MEEYPLSTRIWAWSPVYPWSTKATSTASPVTSGTVAAHGLLGLRSCSLAAGTWRANRWPKVATALGTFAPRRCCAPSYPARVPLSGVDGRVRLSQIAAEGSALRPWASRNTARRSCPMASNTPAVSQRWLCWSTGGHGGRSCGSIRHAAPARTIQRRPVKTSRKRCSRWGASSVMWVK
jgi:hypothetical protein